MHDKFNIFQSTNNQKGLSMQENVLVRLRASDIFTIVKRRPYISRDGYESDPIFNLKFKYNGAHQDLLRGGGIYAVHYRGELLYVGILTGIKIKGQRTGFAGNVAEERLHKHLDVLTMRGSAIGFSRRNYDLSCKLPDHPLVEAIRESGVMRGRDSVNSYPCKVKFACENWEEFKSLEGNSTALDDFTFIYGRLSPGSYPLDIPYDSLMDYLEDIEARILNEMRPRCNLKYHKPNDAKLALGPDLEKWDSLREAIRNPDILPVHSSEND